jgi:hypothetical protein
LPYPLSCSWDGLFFSRHKPKKQTAPEKNVATENAQTGNQGWKKPRHQVTTVSPSKGGYGSRTAHRFSRKKRPSKLIHRFTKRFSATWGPPLRAFKLKKYRQTTNPNSPFVELVTLEQGMGDYLTIQFDDNATGNMPETPSFRWTKIP